MRVCALAAVVGLAGAGTARAQQPLPDQHNIPTNAVSGNVTFEDNVRGVSPGYSSLNFIDYGGDLGDFMFANGTGGLSVWSLKADPAHPTYVANITANQLRVAGDTQDRFWEGENMTVDPKRKLVFLSRDPRGFGGTLTTGTSGVYIIDVKDPYHPSIITFHPIPAGHTSTCINDCQYLWTVGPYSTGTPGNDPSWFPQPAYSVPYGGVPVWVTDISDPAHPYTYTTPIDLNRFDGKTSYAHSVDVDRNGVAWVAGEGGDRGYWTSGDHWDPVQQKNRVATAYDPVPYGGGTTPVVQTSDDFFGYFDHNAQHSTQKVGNYPAGDLLYVTNENIVACPQAGQLKIVSLSGSYDGEAWRSTPQNPFRLQLVGHYTAWGQEGSDTNAGSSCSAHWFTVDGNIIAQAWYAQGTRFIDVSDPANPKQVGYFRIPRGTTGVTAGSASAPYWHNGYVYVADYNRGVDVLKFDGAITGTPEGICWNSCDKAQQTEMSTPQGGVSGSVPATLSLTLGTPASFGAFTPGITNDYQASMTANVISSAGDATLSVADPSSTATGHLVNGTLSMPSPLQARARNATNTGTAFNNVGSPTSPLNLLTYDGPISNDAVSLQFLQHVDANDALRTGTYSKTLTFTLSTTNP